MTGFLWAMLTLNCLIVAIDILMMVRQRERISRLERLVNDLHRQLDVGAPLGSREAVDHKAEIIARLMIDTANVTGDTQHAIKRVRDAELAALTLARELARG